MSEQALASSTTVQRRLSGLLPSPGSGGPEVFLADRDAVAAAVAGGTDPLLYQAWRDVLPPRATPPAPGKQSPEHGPAGTADGLTWSADLVVYQDGTLPGGEPFRSTGHWNPEGQVEVFQVLCGRVLIVAAGTSAARGPYAQYQECVAGDVAVVPLAAWHLTYALDGPAAVFNIYSSQGGNSTAATGAGPAKYRSGQGPVPVAAVRRGSSYAFTWGTTERVAPCELVAAACPEWLGSFLPAGASLADWCTRAQDGELLQLARIAARECQ